MNRFLLAASAAALAYSPAFSPVAASARPMTVTDLHMMHRLGAPSVSPDGRTAIFTLSTTDLDANRRKNVLHSLDLTRPGAQPVAVKGLTAGAHDAVFGADGAIWYLAPVGTRDQLHRMAIGAAPTVLSDFGADVSGFKVSADGSRVVVWADTRDCPDIGCTATTFAAKGPGSGRVYDEMFVRHWDSWTEPGVRSRLFAYGIEKGRLSGPGVRLTGSLTGDTPSKPFGGGEEIALSADGRTVYFALREGGPKEPSSTDLDIYMAPTDGSAEPVVLTGDNEGTDTLPTLSPDGKWLAWASMKRPMYESDRQVLKVRELSTGKVRALTQGWDRSVQSIAWAADGRSLLVTADDTMETPVFRVDATSGKVSRLTGDGHAGNVVATRSGDVVFTMNSVMAPDDLYRLNGGKLAKLTAVNADLLAQLDPVSFDKYPFKGANGDTVWGFTLKPSMAKPTAPLPIAFVVHGGPQGSFGNGWSYRWNPRLFSAPGYAVVSVDFHGSTGYGQAFTDAINDDWGGKPLTDLQRGLAFAIQRDPGLDKEKACALGASYGGTMMNWIAGNWPDRFDCIVQHDGVFDARAMNYETEELWFDDWDHGGKPYFDNPEGFEKHNPVHHVKKWKTPMLVITGEKDFRIPYTQGLAAFTALQRRGIPSRLLVFPDENHWVLKPQNGIQWYGEVFGWLDKWMGKGAGQ